MQEDRIWVARAAGIKVEHTRIVSIVISTVFAGYGMIIYLQNIGTLNTYKRLAMQIGMFSVAALLVGGATVSQAKIRNVFWVILFHIMSHRLRWQERTLSDRASLVSTSECSASYGTSLSLVLYEIQKNMIEIAGQILAQEQGVEA